MFETNTPKDIDKLTLSEAIALLNSEDDSDGVMYSPKVRLKVLKGFCEVLGLDLAPDFALACVAEPPAELCVSTAGSGKTTMGLLKVMAAKTFRESRRFKGKKLMGERILYLVYNRENKPDIEYRQEMMATKLIRGVAGLDIDTHINALTMHGFCDYWRVQYIAKLGFVGKTLLQDDSSSKIMESALKSCIKKFSLDYPIISGKVNNLCLLYNQMKESYKVVADLLDVDKFVDSGLSQECVEYVFDMYDKLKNSRKAYDYTDMLTKIYELLSTDDTVLTRISEFYDYIIADEVQDFTPIMWDILRLLHSKKIPMFCIGDDDQNIYSFRGADIDELLSFSTRFEGAKIYSLDTNRRCKKNILDVGVRVISKNKKRFYKKIQGLKEGGSVNYVGYNSPEGQIISIVEDLKKLSPFDWDKTCICCRNNADYLVTCEYLEEAKIPFHVLGASNSNGVFSHSLYRHLLGILDALENPKDKMSITNLYKVLPVSKAEFFEAIGYSESSGAYTVSHGIKHFNEFDYGTLITKKGFFESLHTLALISDNMEIANMSEYFPNLFDLFKKYYWSFMKKQSTNSVMDELIESRVIEMFNVPKTYKQVYKELDRRKSVSKNNLLTKSGVSISTFHKLKGLEFERVYVTHMSEDIFPATSLLESRNYTDEVKEDIKESDRRLWYVVVTRAIDSLYVYYSKSSPSSYVTELIDCKPEPTVVVDVEHMSSTQEGVPAKLLELKDLDEALPVKITSSSLVLNNDILEPVTKLISEIDEALEDVPKNVVSDYTDDEDDFVTLEGMTIYDKIEKEKAIDVNESKIKQNSENVQKIIPANAFLKGLLNNLTKE